MNPMFLNPKGYTLVEDPAKSSWWEIVYECTLDPKHPLGFLSEAGNRYQPDRHFFTNQGSLPRVPPFVRMIWPKDRFLGFLIHDSGYIHGGLWMWSELCGRMAFKTMTRKQVDDLLYEMILADPIPGNRASAWMIWSHVRMYGGFCHFGAGDSEARYGKQPPTVDPLGTNNILRQA